MTRVLSIFVYCVLFLCPFVCSFRPIAPRSSGYVKAMTIRPKQELRMAFDFPLIPAIVLTTAGVFALFNIDNKVDLTDEGRANARKQRRLEREARGEFKQADPNADPFRYKWFEDSDEEIDILGGGKKGGGCG